MSDRLHEAADRLDALTADASPAPWVSGVCPDTGPYVASAGDVVAGHMSSAADAELAAVLRQAAPWLAEWLRHVARNWEVAGAEQQANAVAYADLVNGADGP